MRTPQSIQIREVSARDGLQAEPVVVGTDEKLELVRLITLAGFVRINVTSFVSPKVIPQMADAAELAQRLPRVRGVMYDATVPNARGAVRAVTSGLDAVSVFVSASDVGSKANVGKSTADAMDQAIEAISVAIDGGLKAFGTVSKAFGSPFGDVVGDDDVISLSGRFVAAGVSGVAFGDTSGEANPIQVQRLVARFFAEFPGVELALHFHDTRGLALANVLAAMDAGAVYFDSAIGGIGGSPLTKNSAGNVATEDLVFMSESMGIDTGIDLDGVLKARHLLRALVGHELPGKLGQLPHDSEALA